MVINVLFIAFFVPIKVLAEDGLNISPYIGVDMQQRTTPFKQSFGSDLFRKSSLQGNFYVGCKFNSYFGVEAGYQVTNRKNRNVSLPVGTVQLGQPVTAPTPGTQEKANKRISGMNLSIMSFLPVSSQYQLDLIGILGLSNLRVKLGYLSVTNNTMIKQVILKQSKTIPRLGVGIQKMIANRFNIRATIIWENTEKFNNVSGVGDIRTSDLVTYTAKLKDSVVYGLGIGIAF